MTIAGDLHVRLRPRLKDAADAELVINEWFDFLSDANTLSFLMQEGCDVPAWCEAVEALKAKCCGPRYPSIKR